MIDENSSIMAGKPHVYRLMIDMILMILQSASFHFSKAVLGQVRLHNLVSEHTIDFIAHGFCAGRAEMSYYLVSCLADTLHKVGLVGSRRCGGGFICIHIDFLSALFALWIFCYDFEGVKVKTLTPSLLRSETPDFTPLFQA